MAAKFEGENRQDRPQSQFLAAIDKYVITSILNSLKVAKILAKLPPPFAPLWPLPTWASCFFAPPSNKIQQARSEMKSRHL